MIPRRMRKSGTRWNLWRWTSVIAGGRLYMRRLHLVETPLGAIMLHWIFRADPNRYMHDHPVDFLSIVLRGWYVEKVPIHRDVIDCAANPGHGEVFTEQRVVGLFNFKRAGDAHRIIAVSDDCLTLVFAGPKRREWGFWKPEGWTHWRDEP